MHKKTFFAAVLIIGAIGTLTPAPGQLPLARPAGIITTTLRGSGGFTSIGLPFTREPALRDRVLSSFGNTITGSAGGYGDVMSTPHSLLILTGANRGTAVRISANTASSITLATAISGLQDNVDEFSVIPEWTFGNLFGTGPNPSGLASSADSNQADIVYIDNGNGSLVQYFHTGANWRSVVGAPTSRNNFSLGGLNGGCLVLKRSAGDVTFRIHGVLRSGRHIATIASGFSVVSYTEAGNTTLGTCGLVPGVLASDASSSVADIVYVPGASGLVQYFHNGTNWRKVAGSPANQNGLPIKAENALIINKRSAGTTQWVVDEK